MPFMAESVLPCEKFDGGGKDVEPVCTMDAMKYNDLTEYVWLCQWSQGRAYAVVQCQ